MFNQEELRQEVQEDFTELVGDFHDNLMSGVVGTDGVTDPLMDYHGMRLNEEIDIQEWQKIACTAFLPPSILVRHDDETCLRLRRVDNGFGRFYFRIQSASRWGEHDLEEMSRSSIKSVPRKLPPSENPNTPALDKDVKTRVQITLKKGSKNVRGQTGNFVIYQVKAADLRQIFEPLLEIYPKNRNSPQTVRVQFTEYRISGGSYRKECGANLNLHNAKVAGIVAYIHNVINKREWDYTSTAGERKDMTEGVLITQEIAKSPAAISQKFYDKERYNGMWCLCKIERGKSFVLGTSKDIAKIVLERSKYSGFTYVINPNGNILMSEEKLTD
jgi:hypothetical protein